tara:strand:- start:301867 stop:302211 length:345 start_codon:yes stop_codon:yes gene_type:complete
MTLNNSTLESLIEILEIEDTKELVAIYFDTASEILHNINLGIEENDAEKIRFWGHRIKGASGTLGLDDLENAGKLLELYGGKGDIKSSIPIINSLNDLLKSAQAAIKKDFPELL